jgi:hypothetical protein
LKNILQNFKLKTMKNFILSVVIALTFISLFSCTKHCEPTLQVEVNFLDESGNLTFTGNQGQGTYTLSPASPIQLLPATGTYTIRITSWQGGCPMFATDGDGNRVANAYSDTGEDNATLTPEYNVYAECE